MSGHLIIARTFKKSLITMLILIAFLCTVISHAQHSDFLSDTVERHQCKLCQQSLDLPTENTLDIMVVANDYYHINNRYVNIVLTPHFYLSSPLRAPPIS